MQTRSFSRVFGPAKAIVKLLSSKNVKSADVLREVQLLRASMSPTMLGRVDSKDRLEFMIQLWTILLNLAEESEPSVYVSVCSAVGSLLFSIFPFFPYTTSESFSCVVREITTVTKASIVVISAFLNIVNSLSPVKIAEFLTKTPVLMHFSVDVSSFIQHLPDLIHLMEPLEVAFHQNLLRSLVSSFGRNPDHYFIDSVVNLIRLEPKILLDELLGYIDSNQLWETLLALGPKLLADETLFQMAGDSREAFVKVALDAIGNKDCQLVDFEQACNTLSNIIQRVDGEELAELRKRIAAAKLPDYPRHYKRFLLSLATSVDELVICDDDSRTLRAAKVASLSKFLQKSANAESLEIATRMVSDILENDSDDVLTSAIMLLNDCFPLLLSHNREATTAMLNEMIKRQNLSWVQNREILYCVMKIDCDVACSLIEGFDTVVIEKSLELCLSNSDELSQVAISCLKLYVNKENLHRTISKLMFIDVFDNHSAVKVIRVIDALYDGLRSSEFETLAKYVIEIVSLHDDPRVAGAGFGFLSNMGYLDVSIDVLNCCIDWIIRLQKSLTQCDSSISSPLKGKEDLPKLLNCIETDIIAVPICKLREEALKPLEACVKYFLSLTSTSDKRAIKFMDDLIFLFPEAILPRAIEYMSHIPNTFHHVVSMIANFTSSTRCAAVCCEFLCFAPPEFRSSAVPAIRSLIQYPKVNSGATIFSFYRFLNFSDSESDVDALLTEAKKRLSDVEIATIEAKLCAGDKGKLKEFTSKIPFSQWPINDDDFCMSLEALDEVFTVTDFDTIDFLHWKYIYEHMPMFNLLDFESYRQRHSQSLKKFETPVEKTETRTISITETKVAPQHPLLFSILRNEYVFGKFAAKSLLKFSKFRLEQDQFNQLFKDVMETRDADLIRIGIEYASRHGLSFDKQFLLENHMEIIRSSPSLMRALASHLTVQDVNLPAEVDLNSLDLKHFDWNSVAMCINGNHYVDLYLPNMHLKSATLIQLTKVLTDFPVSGDAIISFCAKHFHTILKSEKRLVSCLRLLRVAMITVRRSPLLFGKLYAFLDSESALVHMELSKLLLPIFVDVELNTGIIEWLEKANKISEVFCPYLTVMSVLYAYTKCPVNSLTDSMFTDILNRSFDVPSVLINVFTAIEALVKGNPDGWAMFTCVSLAFFAAAQKLHSLPLFDTKIDGILRLVIRRPEFQTHMGLFLPKICDVIFASRPNMPCFGGRMSVLTSLIPLFPPRFKPYAKFFETVLESPDKDPLSLSVVLDGYRWKIGRESNDDSAGAEMAIVMVKYASRSLIEFNRDENITAFMDCLWLPQCDFETAFTGIWKLSLLDFPILKVLVMMHIFKKRCTPSQVDMCKQMISCLYESFEDEKCPKAFELVFDDRPIDAVFMMCD